MKRKYVSGERRFVDKDFFCAHEVLLEEGKAEIYVAMGNWEKIFGVVVEDDESINVYASYNLQNGEVEEDLLLVWKKDKGDKILFYRMDTEERRFMRTKAEAYLKKEGVLLPEMLPITIEFGPGAGELHIGSENSSGCQYQDVMTTEDLREKVGQYIEQYLKD